MALFRSPTLRRIIYVVAFALALMRFATRSHSESLPVGDPLPTSEITRVID